MSWMAIDYHGDLQQFIHSCQKAMMDVSAVNIEIPNDILSYSILGKLSKHSQLYHLGDG